MRGMRPASIIPRVSIQQHIGAIVEEEEKKSSDPKIVEPHSLNSLNSMINKMDQKLIISSTLCEAQMKKLKEMTIAVSKRLTKAKKNSNRIIQVNKRQNIKKFDEIDEEHEKIGNKGERISIGT